VLHFQLFIGKSTGGGKEGRGGAGIQLSTACKSERDGKLAMQPGLASFFQRGISCFIILLQKVLQFS